MSFKFSRNKKKERKKKINVWLSDCTFDEYERVNSDSKDTPHSQNKNVTTAEIDAFRV